MIDSDLIITYTTALYRTAPENSPRYGEFRDMFSAGQLHSKFWLVRELKKTGLSFDRSVIVGSWFATLAFFLSKEFPSLLITCLDIDPRCAVFLDGLTRYSPHAERIKGLVGDLYHHSYDENLVINTSCEHLTDLNSWLEKIPEKTVVVMQSSDFRDHDQHVNCVDSLEQFKKQTESHLRILYAGQLKLEQYTRYMIIGIKNSR